MSKLDQINHLLVCLAEEGGEIAKECCKALRFGLDDQVTLNPDGPRGTEGPTNRDKIVAELNDLMAIVGMLVLRGVIPHDWHNADKQDAKILKVGRYMAYAHKIGAMDYHASTHTGGQVAPPATTTNAA